MKKTILNLIAAVAATGFIGCSNSEKDMAKQEAASLNLYVDSVEKATPIYTQANWNAIDNGYKERAQKAEAALEKMGDEDKAKVEASNAKYATLKLTYETKFKEADAQKASTNDYRSVLRNRLFGEGKIGSDMKLGFVTANNLLSTYQQFVDAVDAGKKDFTREDWDEIKVLYEALDTRKNEVEKDLASADNLKIAKLKVKFATIKSLHRGGTKGKENAEAKE